MKRDVLLEHAHFLRALARGLLGDPDLAEDVVQETWVKALERPPRHAKNVRSWLATVARNLAFRKLRDRKRREARERRHVPRGDLPSPREVAERAELQRALAEAVASLDEPYQSTLIHRYFEDLSPTEIAARAGLPVSTVKTRLQRALDKVRSSIGHKWVPALLALAHPAEAAVAKAAVAKAATTGAILTMKKAVAILAVLAAFLFLLSSERGDDGDSRPRTSQTARQPKEAAGSHSRSEDESESAGDAAKETAAPFVFDGRVVNKGGAGVRGARVRLVYWQSRVFERGLDKTMRRETERREGPETVTGVEGRFRFRRPYYTESFFLVSAEGYADAVSGAHRPGNGITIEVAEEPALLVRVLAAGQPLPGARVRLVSDSDGASARQVLARGETDARGEVRLPAAPAGTLVEVDPREGDLGFVSKRATTGEVVVDVPHVEYFEKRIVDADTGMPVPGAYVVVAQDTSYFSWHLELARRRIRADARGVVRVPRQGELTEFFASAPGYEIVRATGEVIRLRRSMRIEGVVLDRDGAPLPDVPVFVTADSGWERVFVTLPFVAGWSDAGGRFEVEVKMLHPRVSRGLSDSGVRTLFAIHDGLATVVDAIPVEPGRTVAVDLRFPAPSTLEIRLVDARGAPVVGGSIFLTRRIVRAPSWKKQGGLYRLALLTYRQPGQPKTDADGVAVIEKLPPGEYDVKIGPTKATVRLAEGERRRLRIVRGAGPGITGTVLDPHGKPMKGAEVLLSGPHSWIGHTDENGRFVFFDLKPGNYIVSYRSSTGGMIEVPATPGGDVTIRIPAAARLEILVEGPPPGTVEYALVTVHGDRIPARGILAKLRGVTGDFLPGEGVLIVKAKGFGWTAARFDAPAGRTTTVRVSLSKAGSVRTRLENPPEGQVYVRLVRADGFLKSVTGDDRRLVWGVLVTNSLHYQGRLGEPIKDVAPGPYEVICGYYAENRADAWTDIASGRVDVRSGQVAEVALTTD